MRDILRRRCSWHSRWRIGNRRDSRWHLRYLYRPILILRLLDVDCLAIAGNSEKVSNCQSKNCHHSGNHTVCRELRKTSIVPVLMITVRSEEYDRIMGLDIGADD